MQQKKKKVLIVVHQLNYGGVQKALLPALNAIDYTQNEVTLYVRKNRIQLLPNINKSVNKVIVNEDKTHYYRKPYMLYLTACKFMGQLLKRDKWSESLQKKIVAYLNKSQMLYEKKHYFCDKEEYDVAISYIQGYTAQFVAQYISAKKKVMFYHVSTDENHALHEKIMPYYDCIVGVNENVKRILGELYPACKNKMTFIENYVEAEEIRLKSRAYQIPKKNNKWIFCSCGRLAPVKGFDLAIEAAKFLKEKGLSFHWYFVGDGPERTHLEHLIHQYGLTDTIEITGMMDNPYPYLAGCDIYVQPSYEEAHGLAIVEALLLCRPVVTTATVGGQILVCEQINGRITEINAKSLAEGIEKLMEDPKVYRKMIQYLESIDHSNDFKKYQESWRILLEEKENEI